MTDYNRTLDSNIGQEIGIHYDAQSLVATADHTVVWDVLRASRGEIEIRCTGLDANDATVQLFWGNTATDVYESYAAATVLSSATFKDHIEIPVLKGRFLKVAFVKNTVAAGSVEIKIVGRQ